MYFKNFNHDNATKYRDLSTNLFLTNFTPHEINFWICFTDYFSKF